mmetsp:Transcript_34310/g.70252  ORF Transcript_34310/g.70252 Transcript_34310/m.70252 type:complete len:124 (-) Transcript_34310:137-508(-)|eukprot:CAMPEP_0113390944 /NCGR_PEP_ID=MMETSP0013_2-20120614/10446_1 /TAXON_ID=2843 ORGANISM="Skeletonema costatum, Strain 1716" /NCGR_SAMPLE_ID=MMETSP0013_2 /ASSEMBLY_ACC=CAM_ASM_000158 /LENGTH=123 /DNA_ID=CAMNT_0000274153 /DNA_START=104 /DNA_END=475 /DNA_ORIENTATION=- /assembly_acc=CAM_ASM_000158
MLSCRAILLAVAALTLQGRLSESAPTFINSSHHKHRPSTAEQTFVRGMMAADHQFGLYMTISETSRGGGSETVEDDVRDERIHPTIRACEDAMIRARKAAFRVGNSVRREAIRHLPSNGEKSK